MKLKRFYSFCSRHHPSRPDPECAACNTGHYSWIWNDIVSAWFYGGSPFSYAWFFGRTRRRIWLWWMNDRPGNNRRKSFFTDIQKRND